MDAPVWQPSLDRVERSAMTRFRRILESSQRTDFPTYQDFHRFSVERPDIFWDAVWTFADVVGDRGSGEAIALADARKMLAQNSSNILGSISPRTC